MRRELFIEVGPIETRTALVDAGHLSELRIESNFETSLLGSVWLGRVRKIVPALQAAFVDIGQAQDGFLTQKHARYSVEKENRDKPIERILHEGQKLLVQVKREPVGGKGASLTTALSGAVDTDIATSITPPHCVQQAPVPLNRSLRDFIDQDVVEIIVEPSAAFLAARRYLTEHASEWLDRLRVHTGQAPLFDQYDLEQQIAVVLATEVELSGGGLITLEATRALTAIDVDSRQTIDGSDLEKTALKVNCEAAVEIARQIRLRDIGGLIVIDFVQLKNPDSVKKLMTVLRNAVSQDRAPIRMTELSSLGLVEIARQRRGQSLDRQLGTERHVAMALRAVARAAHQAPGRGLNLDAAPGLIMAIEKHHASTDFISRLGVQFTLQSRSDFASDVFEVTTN